MGLPHAFGDLHVSEDIVPAKTSETDKTTDDIHTTGDSAVDVVQKGMPFLTDLVGVLKDPDASRRMVDSIVTEESADFSVTILSFALQDERVAIRTLGYCDVCNEIITTRRKI